MRRNVIISIDIGTVNLGVCVMAERPSLYDATPSSLCDATPSDAGLNKVLSAIPYVVEKWFLINLVDNTSTANSVVDDVENAATHKLRPPKQQLCGGATFVERLRAADDRSRPSKRIQCDCKARPVFSLPRPDASVLCAKHARQVDADAATPFLFLDQRWSGPNYKKRKVGDMRDTLAHAFDLLGEHGRQVMSFPKSKLVDQMTEFTAAHCMQPLNPIRSRSRSKTRSRTTTDGANGCTIHLTIVARRLIEQLSATFVHSGDFSNEDVNVTSVLIENQIGPKANRMMAVQSAVTMYFMMQFPQAVVHSISSKHKLAVAALVAPPVNANETHCDRKQTSEISTRLILTRYPQIGGVYTKEWFLSGLHPKKDDIADAFLQCLWFIINEVTHVLRRDAKTACKYRESSDASCEK